ncbi:hypothetical protein [Microbacterium neungamense]|uniref:hypothetical protein n=1 Tax=Microbacterium neungamense TaxID=2810535 RepID=UPI00217E24FC|nr:hypothetical protein [Microbacterium neungamense]UWF78147.1 hypothetical protein JSY13_03705 [Microbacterium neungamense]
MYILLALIAACALGVAMHFALPHRELRGVAVTPAVATAAAAAIYTGMQWAGVAEADVRLWVASLGGALLLALVATLALTAQRRRTDAEAKRALGI